MEPSEVLAAGSSILERALRQAGFERGEGSTGNGSGGRFAVGRWSKGDTSIELHVRLELGTVRYGWGGEWFDHAAVCDALGAKCSYPGFSDDPLDGFRHLLEDLEGPLAEVLGPRTEDVHQVVATTPPRKRYLP